MGRSTRHPASRRALSALAMALLTGVALLPSGPASGATQTTAQAQGADTADGDPPDPSATSTDGAQDDETDPADPSTEPGTDPDPGQSADPAAGTDPGEPVDPDPAPDDPGTPEAPADPGDPADASDTGDPADPALDDPLVNEGGSEDPPAVDPEIPPPPTYGGQEPYVPPEILWSSVAEAERKLERAQEAKREAVARARTLRRRAKHLSLDLGSLDAETRATVDELDRATNRFRQRAVIDFRLFGAGDGPGPDLAVDPSRQQRELDRRRGSRLAATALGLDREDLARLGSLRAELDADTRETIDQLRIVDIFEAAAVEQVAVAEEAIVEATTQYEAFRAGSEIFIEGVVYPIGGQPEVPTDSFGFPRMVGTPDEHWHEGIDLFAPRGTPLVAAERGMVTRIGAGRLGGLKLWIVGESGTEWYYAHLDSFAPGLADGQLVEAGDLVGYVGNTGNAVGTPPHLHLQMHPDGGRPINPFPLLRVVWETERAEMAAGLRSPWDYPPVVVPGRDSPAALDGS